MKIAASIAIVLISIGLARADDDLIDADRPGIADGSHTVKHGRSQIEFGVDVSRDEHAFPMLFRYGITDRFELRAENDDGSNPFSLGFKEHFFERQNASAGVIGRWFVSHHSHGDLRLAADLNFGERWSVNPNVGLEKPGGGTAALTIQYNLTKKANVFIDGGAARSSALLDAGAAWIVGTDTQVDASVTRSAHGAARPVVWSAGVSRRF